MVVTRAKFSFKELFNTGVRRTRLNTDRVTCTYTVKYCVNGYCILSLTITDNGQKPVNGLCTELNVKCKP